MKDKSNIDELFKELENEFDIYAVPDGSQKRFLQKLNQQNNKLASVKTDNKLIIMNWLRPLSIAASLLLLVGLVFQLNFNQNKTAKVPEEVEKAQFYFTSLINEEITKINQQATPDTKQMVADVMKQIQKLEENYKVLEQKLTKNGNTKQLIHAMITNFQTRINLLQEVLDKIENVKQLKQTEYENVTI